VASAKLRRNFDVEDDSDDEDTIRGALEDSDEEKYVKTSSIKAFKAPREERKAEEPLKIAKRESAPAKEMPVKKSYAQQAAEDDSDDSEIADLF